MPMRREVCALSLALALVSKSNGIAASSANTLHPIRAPWFVIDVDGTKVGSSPANKLLSGSHSWQAGYCAEA